MALYGTGLGALPTGSDTSPPPVGNLRSDVMVYVAGVPVKPLYVGRAPTLFGVDQINFVLPTGIQEGCYLDYARKQGVGACEALMESHPPIPNRR
jgi:uncharacterized protein (TIGR03437 family)